MPESMLNLQVLMISGLRFYLRPDNPRPSLSCVCAGFCANEAPGGAPARLGHTMRLQTDGAECRLESFDPSNLGQVTGRSIAGQGGGGAQAMWVLQIMVMGRSVGEERDDHAR